MATLDDTPNFYERNRIYGPDIDHWFDSLIRQIGGTVFARRWIPSTTKAAQTSTNPADYASPTTFNGHKYKCIVGGVSAGSEPTWPTTAGGTVTDGGVTWQEDGSPYVTYPGNLDTNNFPDTSTTAVNFTNRQKAEPFAHLPLTFYCVNTGTANEQVLCDLAPCNMRIYAATMIYTAGGPLTGGHVTVNVNTVQALKLRTPSRPSPIQVVRPAPFEVTVTHRFGFQIRTGRRTETPTGGGGPAESWGVALDVNENDVIAVDFSKCTGTAATDVQFVLWGKALHVP